MPLGHIHDAARCLARRAGAAASCLSASWQGPLTVLVAHEREACEHFGNMARSARAQVCDEMRNQNDTAGCASPGTPLAALSIGWFSLFAIFDNLFKGHARGCPCGRKSSASACRCACCCAAVRT